VYRSTQEKGFSGPFDFLQNLLNNGVTAAANVQATIDAARRLRLKPKPGPYPAQAPTSLPVQDAGTLPDINITAPGAMPGWVLPAAIAGAALLFFSSRRR
jgi:hypothetical protein